MTVPVLLRVRLPDGGFSDPVPVPFDDYLVPELESQFITPDGRAFGVTLIERRLDLHEVHVFCVEYPKAEPPRADSLNAFSARFYDEPVETTRKALLYAAIFDMTCFGAAAAIFSKDWKVGLLTVCAGFVCGVVRGVWIRLNRTTA